MGSYLVMKPKRWLVIQRRQFRDNDTGELEPYKVVHAFDNRKEAETWAEQNDMRWTDTGNRAHRYFVTGEPHVPNEWLEQRQKAREAR